MKLKLKLGYHLPKSLSHYTLRKKYVQNKEIIFIFLFSLVRTVNAETVARRGRYRGNMFIFQQDSAPASTP